MALPLTGITTSMVASAIGEVSNDVGKLCTSNKINKWSKYKPVKHSQVTGLSDSQFSALKYGINIFALSSTVGSSYDNANWNYNKPTSLSPKRLGDFRRYEHSVPTPLLQKHGTSEIVFANFVNKNNNIMFDILRTPTDIASYALNIENIATEGGSVVYGNYYLAADIYPRGVTSGSPLLTIYSLNKIGYSEGTYNEDDRSIRLSEPSIAPGDYEYHLYMSTHKDTVPLGELRENYPINWTTSFPNKINMSIKTLAEQFIVKFVGIKPASGTWPDGTTGYKTGALQNYGNNSSSDFGTLRNFIARFQITNNTGQTVYIPRSSLRVNYNYQNTWTDADVTNTYGSVESGGNIMISNGATVYFDSASLRLLPTNIPSGSIDITVFPTPRVYKYNIVPVGQDPYEAFSHNLDAAVSLRFIN